MDESPRRTQQEKTVTDITDRRPRRREREELQAKPERRKIQCSLPKPNVFNRPFEPEVRSQKDRKRIQGSG